MPSLRVLATNRDARELDLDGASSGAQAFCVQASLASSP